MEDVRIVVNSGGRVVIPAAYRRALGLRAGDEVILRLEDGEVRIPTRARAIRSAQSLVRRYIPEGRSLANELIAERRSESAVDS